MWLVDWDYVVDFEAVPGAAFAWSVGGKPLRFQDSGSGCTAFACAFPLSFEGWCGAIYFHA